jgi:AcrR family transcriptional regulator
LSRGDFKKMNEIKSKRELNKAKKEALFINAAEKLFMKKGFENTSINEVAKEAGLTKRTLYQYFQSKEDLFMQSPSREPKSFMKHPLRR